MTVDVAVLNSNYDGKILANREITDLDYDINTAKLVSSKRTTANEFYNALP